MFSFSHKETKALSDIVAIARSDPRSKDAWAEILSLFAKVIPCDAVGVAFFDDETGRPTSHALRNSEPAAYDEYETYYHAKDPITPRALKKGLQVFRPTDVMPRKAYERTEFYTDFSMAHRVPYPLAALVGPGHDRRAQLWLTRGITKHPFSRRDKQVLELLQPHLASALVTPERPGGADLLRTALQPSVDLMQSPILFFDKDFKLEYMNAAAIEICESAAVRADCALDRIIAAAREPGDGGPHPFFSLDPRERGDCVIGGRRYAVAVFPLQLPGSPTQYVILLADVLDQLRRTLTRSMYAHGLSPREIEVCGLLVKGLSDREIAEALCIADLTVKDHVKSIREKLGVTSRNRVLSKLLSS